MSSQLHHNNFRSLPLAGIMRSPLHHNDVRSLTHQGDGLRHRYGSLGKPDQDGPYKNKPFDGYIFMSLVFFLIFLGALPFILRRCGCAPPRPERLRLQAQHENDGDQPAELSEEERKELVEKSLSTVSVASHSTSGCTVCSSDNCESLAVPADGSGRSKPLPEQTDLMLSPSTTSTAQEDDADTSGSSIDPCHICLERFQVDDQVSWSNVSNCKHAFHEACIKEWMMKHDDCPCCRSKILHVPADDTRTNSDGDEVEVVVRDGSDCESLCENEPDVEKGEGGRDGDSNGKVDSDDDCSRQKEELCFCIVHGLQASNPGGKDI